MKKYFMLLGGFLFACLLCSCETIRMGGGTDGGHQHPQHDPPPAVKKGGPPSHAPAHGYRKKFDYRYYPSKKVYYCAQRRLYFWIEGDGWRLGTSLPSNINLSGGESLSVDISEDTPYFHYEKNYQEDLHPGKGKAKGKYKNKNKDKGKGKGKNK